LSAKVQVAKVPGTILSGEQKFQGARKPGSESSRERIGRFGSAIPGVRQSGGPPFRSIIVI